MLAAETYGDALGVNMDSDTREKLRKHLCGRENVLVPVWMLKDLIADSEAKERVEAAAGNLRQEADEAREDAPEVADALDFGAVSINEALGHD